MTRVICRVAACVFWEQGICTAEEIEYEPDEGCLTFQDAVDLELAGEEEEEDLDWEVSGVRVLVSGEGWGGDDWEEEEDQDEDDLL